MVLFNSIASTDSCDSGDTDDLDMYMSSTPIIIMASDDDGSIHVLGNTAVDTKIKGDTKQKKEN